jgi:hypothetical protein
MSQHLISPLKNVVTIIKHCQGFGVTAQYVLPGVLGHITHYSETSQYNHQPTWEFRNCSLVSIVRALWLFNIAMQNWSLIDYF